LESYLSHLSEEDIEAELAKRKGGGYSSPFDTSGGRKVLSKYVNFIRSTTASYGARYTSKPQNERIRFYRNLREFIRIWAVSCFTVSTIFSEFLNGEQITTRICSNNSQWKRYVLKRFLKFTASLELAYYPKID
jgi:hypothetical protein